MTTARLTLYITDIAVAEMIYLTLPCKDTQRKKTQWNDGIFIIATGIDIDKLDLNVLKNNPHVRKIIYQVDKELGSAEMKELFKESSQTTIL